MVEFAITANYTLVNSVQVKFPSKLVVNNLCFVDPTTTLDILSMEFDGTDIYKIQVVPANTSKILKFVCDQVITGAIGAVSTFEVHMWETYADTLTNTPDHLIQKNDALDPGIILIVDPNLPHPHYFEWVYDSYWADYQPETQSQYGPLRFTYISTAAMTAAGTFTVEVTLDDMTKLVPFPNSDLLSGWTDVEETELFCEIDNIEHSCTYNSGQNKITIVISTDVAAGEHFYKISHKGVLDKTKGGFHMGSDYLETKIQV